MATDDGMCIPSIIELAISAPELFIDASGLFSSTLARKAEELHGLFLGKELIRRSWCGTGRFRHSKVVSCRLDALNHECSSAISLLDNLFTNNLLLSRHRVKAPVP
jgi:hypothetical protein